MVPRLNRMTSRVLTERRYNDLPHRVFTSPRRVDFREMEAIMRAHDGRPHRGKGHARTAADLAPAYQRFGEFLAMRDRLDPERVFANEHLRRVLGP